MRKATRLSEWAKQHGYSYRGAYKAYHSGNIPGAYAMPSGAIMVAEHQEVVSKPENTVIYARVSSPKQKDDLTSQARRVSDFCAANGWVVNAVKKEISSGLNDNRKILNSILDDATITRVVVEHKDRLTRFGFNYLIKLLESRGCQVVVINNSEEDEGDLMQDFVSLITSMVARLYGLRRSKRRTQAIIDGLRNG